MATSRLVFALAAVLCSVGTGVVRAQDEIILRAEVTDCDFGGAGITEPCGVAGAQQGETVPWQVEVSACSETVDVFLAVVLESRLEPCASEPALCDKAENFSQEGTFGCTDGLDNDSDGLTDLEDPDCVGIKGWSFSMATDDCFIPHTVSVGGTVSDIETLGGKRSLSGSFARFEVVDPNDNAGQNGVVSAIVLGFVVPVILDQVSVNPVLRVGAQMSLQAPGPCVARFDTPPEGLRGLGDPVRTVVTVGGGLSVVPRTDVMSIELVPSKGGGGEDCNTNEIPDECEIGSGAAQDCNTNQIPDECDIASGVEQDCDTNGVPDSCDITSGAAQDCDTNGVPDSCDITSGTAQDCDTNGVPDSCDITSGTAQDCDTNGVPDSCDITSGMAQDCNTNMVPDSCDLGEGTSQDCNTNMVPDECDIAGGDSLDGDENGVPDECEAPGDLWIRGDCDGDGLPCTGVGDALVLLNFAFLGIGPPGCLSACDVDGSGEIEGVTDALFNLGFCFLGRDAPPAPHPDCGTGTETDAVLGCLAPPEACQ